MANKIFTGVSVYGFDGTNSYPLPLAASGVAVITNSWTFDGTGTAIHSTSNALDVYITGGGSSGVQYTDGTAETAGAFTITVAGSYNGTDVVGLRSDTSNYLNVDMQSVAGVALGATGVSHFATAPAAVNVQGVNANIFSAGAAITAAAPLATQLSQGNAVISAANPIFSALSIAGAVVSATNGEYANLLQGNAILSSTNPTFVNISDGTHALTAAISAWGTAPTGTEVMGVNANLFSGNTVLTNTSGALNVNISSSSVTDPAEGVPGAAAPGYALQVGGSDGTDLRALLTSTTGQLHVIADSGSTTVVTGTVAENLTQVAGVTLGSTAVTNFGTAPAAAAVPGVNASLFAGTTGITATGSSLNVNVTGTTGTVTVAGTLTNNNAAPSTNNVGVLPAIANAIAPSYTEGYQTLLSTDLDGNLRVTIADEGSSASNFSADTGAGAGQSNTGSLIPLITIQANGTKQVRLRGIDLMGDGNQVYYQLLKNATLTTPTYVATSGTVKYDVSSTSFTGGTLIDSGYFAVNPRTEDYLQIAIYLAAGTPGDHFTVAVQAVNSSTATIYGAIRWSEQ